MEAMILLVDDNSTMLTLMHRILHKAVPDYELLSVMSGTAALALIAQRPIALVITDQHMPDMDGMALTVAIKAVAPQCQVILVTGSTTIEMRLHAEAAGADFFLLKPFGYEQLAPIVRAALGR
jgi:DNA-binding NtrC family response regulator